MLIYYSVSRIPSETQTNFLCLPAFEINISTHIVHNKPDKPSSTKYKENMSVNEVSISDTDCVVWISQRHYLSYNIKLICYNKRSNSSIPKILTHQAILVKVYDRVKVL